MTTYDYPLEDPGSGAPQPASPDRVINNRGTMNINGEQVPLANWSLRVISGLVDYGPALFLMNVISNMGVEPQVQYNPNTGLYEQSGGGFIAGTFDWLGWLVFLAIVIANSVVLQGMTGQSLGKRLTGTQLIWGSRDRDGRPHVYLPGIGVAAVRAVLQVLNAIFLIGFLVPLFSFNYQSWTDMAVKTYVLRRPERTLSFK